MKQIIPPVPKELPATAPLLLLLTCPTRYRLEIADELDVWISRYAPRQGQILLNGITHRKNGFLLFRWEGMVPPAFLDRLRMDQDIHEILLYPLSQERLSLKRGMLTAEGARRLGVPELAEHEVEYEPRILPDGQVQAHTVYHQGTRLGEALTAVPFGPDGIMPLPLPLPVPRSTTTLTTPTTTDDRMKEQEEPPHDA
jgi:hypothetical protein